MKKSILYIVVLIAILFSSCEDVVQVDLNTAAPKLVVEASINWSKGTDGKSQIIKLTTTTDYYSNTIPIVSGASVSIKNSSNTVFNFVETPNTGEYKCSNFVPVLNETYVLTVVSNGQTYTATETMMPVAPITKIVQNDTGGFSGDTVEIKSYYNDPAVIDNYYLYQFVYSNKINSSYNVSEDKFYQGNEFFSISRNSDIKVGDTVVISHFGISKTYFNYMKVLISISGNNSGGPFQSPSATVRGNIINTTTFDNYALGFFSLSEVDTKSYIVQ